MVESRDFGKEFQRSCEFLRFLFNLFITGVLVIIPQNTRPEAAAPFIFRSLAIIPVVLAIQDITRHHRIVNLTSLSTHDVQSTMHLTITIIQFLINNQLLF